MPALFPNVRRSFSRVIAGTACALWLAPTALAATGSTTPARTTPATGEATPLNLADSAQTQAASHGSGGGLARTIVGLFVVIAVIYGVTWVLRQVKASRLPDDESAGTGGLESTATLGLGTGRALHLVRAGNEWLLLGVTDGGIQPLRSYTEQEALAAGLPIDQADAVDELRPAPNPLQAGPLAMVERLRGLTVRR